MPHSLAYALPRAVIVLGAWGAAYFVLTALSTRLAPAVIYMTGVAWVMAGVVCFGYLYRLRSSLGLLPHQLRAAAEAAAAKAIADAAAMPPAQRKLVQPMAAQRPAPKPVPILVRLRALSVAR